MKTLFVLAEAMSLLATSPDFCRRLGEAGHAKVRERFEAAAVTKALLSELDLAGAASA